MLECLCVDVFFVLSIYVNNSKIMDTFSLEDEDMSGLFITQESSQSVDNFDENNDEELDSILGVAADDFGSPCISLLPQSENYSPEVSDISDDDKEFDGKRKRYIFIAN